MIFIINYFQKSFYITYINVTDGIVLKLDVFFDYDRLYMIVRR